MGRDPTTWAVILAGGASARFWPVDGDDRPKFMLRPSGRETLIQMALERCLEAAALERVMVVTGAVQAGVVQEELWEIRGQNVIAEPERRDTLPAIGLAMAEIVRRGGGESDAVMVTPSDSWLAPVEAMGNALREAAGGGALASAGLCCFTVDAVRPETGFGYLEIGGRAVSGGVITGVRFVEKPDSATSRRWVEAKSHVWNTGSFAWTVGAFRAALDAAQPGAWAALIECANAIAKGDTEAAAAVFSKVARVSVDFGLMEKAAVVSAIPLDAEFDDIGTWDALARHGGLVAEGRSRDGCTVLQVSSTGCEALGEGSFAFVGVRDVIVVREGGRILVMGKGHGQDVRKARELAEAERRGRVRGESGVQDPGSPVGVLLAVDLGDVRTGVAVCDDLGMLASPLELIVERDRDVVARRVAELCTGHRAVCVVVGLPVNMDGSEGDRAAKSRAFGDRLLAIGVPRVEYRDERLTSWEAEGKLREAGHRGRERKAMVDVAAAVGILESYLGDVRRSKAGGGEKLPDNADFPWEKPGWQKAGFRRDSLSPESRKARNSEQRARRKGR